MANPGSKSGGLAWLFAFGSVVVALLINVLAGKLSLPNTVTYGMYVGVIGAAGVAAVYLTRAGAGMGIVAFLVASIAMAIGTYILVSMSAAEIASTAVRSTDGSASIQLNAGAASTVGAIAGVVVAVLNFFVTFIAGLTGCLIGGSMKKKALAAAPAAQARLAA